MKHAYRLQSAATVTALQLAQEELQRCQDDTFALAARVSRPGAEVRAIFYSNPFNGQIDRAALVPVNPRSFDSSKLPLGWEKLKSHDTLRPYKPKKKSEELSVELEDAMLAARRQLREVQPKLSLSKERVFQGTGLPESATTRKEPDDGRRWHIFPGYLIEGDTVYVYYDRGELEQEPGGDWVKVPASQWFLAVERAEAARERAGDGS